MRTRVAFRPLGLGLLSVAAAGVLLQIGPADASSEQATRSTAPPTKQQALAAYEKVPLAFVPNAGQTDARVRFSAQAKGFSVFLTRREAMLVLRHPAKGTRRGEAIALRFLGASKRTEIRGERRTPGTVNYFLGNDPAKWRTGLPGYERVVYRNLWPGIDMVLQGRSGELKYEFHVRPGAQVAKIRLAYRGAKGLSLDRRGNLRIRTRHGVLGDTRPTSYQIVGGRRVPVASSFALDRTGAGYGFALGRNLDRRYPLVIDPGLAYSTYLGGSGHDKGYGIALDGTGAAYVTGSTTSADFPTTGGALGTTFNGGVDAFVTKLDASGGALVYSTYLGGSSSNPMSEPLSEGAYAIALDAAGNAYLTGIAFSEDFPTTAGAFDRTFNGGYSDAFVTKLDASGGALVYSSYLGGGQTDEGRGIAVDAAGDAYVTGRTSGNFPTTADALDTNYNGGYSDAFVTKLDASGAALVYSSYLGGSGGNLADGGSGIALDAAGDAYVTGYTTSTDFPTTAGAFDTTFNGGRNGDAFVTKLDASGGALVYSTYLGGSGYWGDAGSGIALDGAGEAYVTGLTQSANFPTTAGAFDTTNYGADAFVTKLDASGAALVYSTYLGRSGSDQAYGIALDAAGNAYVTGYTNGDFPTTAGALDTSFNGGNDAFVTKLHASGAALGYSSYLGGSNSTLGTEYGMGIAVDGASSAYLIGQAGSADFPTTAGAFDTTFNSGTLGDAFVTKLDLPPPRCIVPWIIGMKVSRAKSRIQANLCSVGRVRRARFKRVGRVIAQSRRPGKRLAWATRVNLVVGRR